jgi:hypothetical protein
MKKIILFFIVLGICLIFLPQAYAEPIELVADVNATLQPGVWAGWVLGSSSLDRGFVVEISPLEPSLCGHPLNEYVVQPEFNGTEWNDVLRVMNPEGCPEIDVNIRVYEISGLPVVSDFNATLQPGVWAGWVLGSSSVDRGFVVEISPLEPSINGASIEKYVVQPEFNGVIWRDVLRVQIPGYHPQLDVNIRVYGIEVYQILPVLINKFVTFKPDSSTYSFTPDTSDCPAGFAGKFSFDATLANHSEKKLSKMSIHQSEQTFSIVFFHYGWEDLRENSV